MIRIAWFIGETLMIAGGSVAISVMAHDLWAARGKIRKITGKDKES